MDDLLGELIQYSVSTDSIDDTIMQEENEILSPLLKEIDLINNAQIKLFVRSVLLNAPPHFWTCPSSVSGKYHPPDEHVENGNILHTRRVVHLAELIVDMQDRSPVERDIAIAASLIHDITKYVQWEDGSLHYDPMHPYTADLMVRKLKEVQEELMTNTNDDQPLSSSTVYIDDGYYFQIMKCVRTHLGLYSPIPETYPTINVEWIVHMADNIASHYHYLVDNGEVDLSRWKITKKKK